ncbi:MAG: hypothetical protein SVY41_02200 [Candidatus Nanohaloarchaea archaeon]|nr:hypothetical protein [Candidatus Nanohaloarchaea archaeon]
MSTLSGDALGIRPLDGVDQDAHNGRDKAGFLTETVYSPDELYDIVRDFHRGEGRFADYHGFADSEHPRGVVRVLMDRDVDRDRPYRVDGTAYTLEGRVPIPETSQEMGWIGTLLDGVQRPQESDWRQHCEGLWDCLTRQAERVGLPDGYQQAYWNDEEDVAPGDVNDIYDLLVTCFDDSYIVPLTRDFVSDWFLEEPVSTVIRDETGGIVATAAAEVARAAGTGVGMLEVVEISEVASHPDYRGQQLAAYNVQVLCDLVDGYDGKPVVYSQNTAAEPGMTRVATRNGGEFSGVLEGHATVSNPWQDLVLTRYSGGPDGG